MVVREVKIERQTKCQIYNRQRNKMTGRQRERETWRVLEYYLKTLSRYFVRSETGSNWIWNRNSSSWSTGLEIQIHIHSPGWRHRLNSEYIAQVGISLANPFILGSFLMITRTVSPGQESALQVNNTNTRTLTSSKCSRDSHSNFGL